MSNDTPLISFHGDPAIKEKYVNRLKQHRKAEELIQGIGWEDGKGCAIGCTLENYDHAQFPPELGLPIWLAHLIDSTFEGLPKGEAEQFAEDVLEVIPVGVDIDPIRHTIAIQRMERLLLEQESNDREYAAKVRNAIKQVIAYHKNPIESAARSAESATWIATWSATRSATWIATWSATWSAARSAENTARSAAQSAESAARSAESAAWNTENTTWSAAESVAESAKCAAYEKEAQALIQALKEAGK